jgi:hypothetical protein
MLANIALPDVGAKLRIMWSGLFWLFLPVLIFTSFKDPILAVFASKQYLLYIIIGILVTVSFPPEKEQQFRKFILYASLLLIPTTIVAILQNSLPASHWLNLSVTGSSLENFSAAGYLRVGSTFSFTGQYSWFLNAESFFLATSFFMQPFFKNQLIQRFLGLIYVLLIIMLMIAAFITGGRTAVLGCGGILSLGLILIGVKRQTWFFTKGAMIIILCVVSLSILRVARPEFF